LSGVLKDIILVVASILIWSSPISLTQAIGYSIALFGLVLYKTGGSILGKTGFTKRTLVVLSVIGIMSLVIGFLAVNPDYPGFDCSTFLVVPIQSIASAPASILPPAA
jgi:hypothetical protein